jgi:hypothetical protein
MRPSRLSWLAGAALLGASVWLLDAADAQACTRPAPAEFSIDARAKGLAKPPPAPTRVTGTASRSSGYFCASDGTCTVNTCGSSGSLQVAFESTLDQATAYQVGYRLRFVEGSMPAEIEEPISAIAVGASPLTFELPFESVTALDATFELVAIDRAGNESEASEPFRVSFDGCTRTIGLAGCVEDTGGRVTCSDGMCSEEAAAETGCGFATMGSHTAASLGLALAALGLTLRRRR